MNSEVRRINKGCAEAEGACVHKWRKTDFGWKCDICNKHDVQSINKPPTTDIDYCKTSGSALKFCERVKVYAIEGYPECIFSRDDITIYSPTVKVSAGFDKFESIDRACGFATCWWALEVLKQVRNINSN